MPSKNRPASCATNGTKFETTAELESGSPSVESIEFERRAVGVVPHLSEGVALATLFAFHRRTTASTSHRAQSDFYGDRAGAPDPPNLFGVGYNDIAHRMFSGHLIGEDVLNRHTLFGFYGRLLPSQLVARWKDDLSNYRRTTIAQYLDNKIGPFSTVGAYGLLRRCRACVGSDLENGLVPGWRVLHQLPFLRHCVEHSELLTSHCPNCAEPMERGTTYRLPSDPCRHCGSTEWPRPAVETCQGQLQLGRLCERIFRGMAPELEALQWPRWVRELRQRFGTVEAAATQIEKSLLVLWNATSIGQISESLGLALANDFVVVELKLETNPRVWLPRLLVFAAAETLPFNEGQAQESEDAHSGAEAQSPVRRLYLLAGTGSIPDAVVDRLVAGEAMEAVTGARMVTHYRLRMFLDSLPHDLRQFLKAARERGKQDRRAASPSKAAKHEALRAESRQALLDLLSSNPNLARFKVEGLISTRYAWLIRHDREWLDAVLPSRRPHHAGVQGWYSRFESVAERRESHRKAVLELLQKEPLLGRSEVYARLCGPMSWLLANDRAWCGEHVPIRARNRSSFTWYRGKVPLVLPEPMLKARYRSDAERTAVAKRFLTAVKRLNPHLTRTELCRLCRASVQWLRVADPDWLEHKRPRPRK